MFVGQFRKPHICKYNGRTAYYSPPYCPEKSDCNCWRKMIMNPRSSARAIFPNWLHRGSTGRWPAHPDPGIILFVWSAQHPWPWRSTL